MSSLSEDFERLSTNLLLCIICVVLVERLICEESIDWVVLPRGDVKNMRQRKSLLLNDRLMRLV